LPYFTYQVVRHGNGWAYRLELTYSRVFLTKEEAINAATDTARQMHEPGDYTRVRVQNAPLTWHTELVIRPGITVVG
jgi:hypothetical protein